MQTKPLTDTPNPIFIWDYALDEFKEEPIAVPVNLKSKDNATRLKKKVKTAIYKYLKRKPNAKTNI